MLTMEESTSKEKILKSVREALLSKTDQPYPKIDYEKTVFRPMEDTPDINFAKELKKTGGEFVYCESENELTESIRILVMDKKWASVFALEKGIIDILNKGNIPCISDPGLLTQSNVAMTGCESLVARLGSVLVSTGQKAGRRIFSFPEVHLVIAYASQVVNDLNDALGNLKKKYSYQMPSQVTLITGPSRTADIEKTLVLGVHGPKELYVFMLEDRF